jgi:hypothetical protein
MKKQAGRKITLHKETLRQLAEGALRAAGGASTYGCSLSCDGTCRVICASNRTNCC